MFKTFHANGTEPWIKTRKNSTRGSPFLGFEQAS